MTEERFFNAPREHVQRFIDALNYELERENEASKIATSGGAEEAD